MFLTREGDFQNIAQLHKGKYSGHDPKFLPKPGIWLNHISSWIFLVFGEFVRVVRNE